MAIGPTINDIKEITSVLSEKLRMDFNNYAFSFLRRRFAYVFNALKVKNSNAFIHSIRSGDIIDDFCYTFPVSETEMFRDPAFWRILCSKVFPSLSEENMTFWFPELSSAEELFSLLVVLQEEKLLEKANIYCNVTSDKRINEIKKGAIDSKNLDLNKSNFKRLEIDTEFEEYFTAENGYVTINPDLLRNITFIKDNYFNALPDREIGVTIFRNKMIYYNYKLQLFAENYLKQNLNKGAYLVLGIKEFIQKDNQDCFELYDSAEKIYKVS